MKEIVKGKGRVEGKTSHYPLPEGTKNTKVFVLKQYFVIGHGDSLPSSGNPSLLEEGLRPFLNPTTPPTTSPVHTFSLL